jgi:hypothetical protein
MLSLILWSVLLDRLQSLGLAFVMFVPRVPTVFLVLLPAVCVPPGPAAQILRIRLSFVLKAFSRWKAMEYVPPVKSARRASVIELAALPVMLVMIAGIPVLAWFLVPVGVTR